MNDHAAIGEPESEVFRLVVSLNGEVAPAIADAMALGMITGAAKGLREISRERLSEREFAQAIMSALGHDLQSLVALLAH